MESLHKPNAGVKSRKVVFVQGLKNLIPLKTRTIKVPHVTINFESSRYQVKTATTYEERKEAYRLRYEVFYGEFCQKEPACGIDKDSCDDVADLLLIIDKKSGKIIGTYRLICSLFSDKFYSAKEFTIERFLDTGGTKVELSRACIHKDFRNGLVIALLWKGIFDYLSRVKARYLFGCSSINQCSPVEILSLINFLHSNRSVDDQWRVVPYFNYDKSVWLLREIKGLAQCGLFDLRCFPPLFRAYLNAGAKIASVPAYDEQFLCYDFFTMLDVELLKQSHLRKFGK